ncbi:pyridoxamine 5'-phosphate oxidase family protein [Gordonia sp. HY002]|uniref:pyridoxamine 5'-phosphate oxidase family protein n=1 Tax=Gordonia zhenghanii TaxID=2911516 RepID=UPI001EEF9EC9|nr:pyridoxamine 5'-phosphate oxidase family protein [Gordonia zhenghanii]MCF8570923.1 pyridoxamine 5'-phosphate oxidase family protein [Gordonia zhenghanii]MCF8607900.1 pyridoxamine 5'-phosphate oxidase family protein [Gordonia zhenghanii]
MGTRYQHLAYGDAARARQHAVADAAVPGAAIPDDGPQELTSRELRMLTRAFQLHLATVTESGWPYVQYRSGPTGFVHHLGGNRIAFADFRGNRQFVSTGNIDADGRVALFVADYPLRKRLKVFGRAVVSDDPALLERLRRVDDGEISAVCERSIVIGVEAFDWNCSRSLVPQYTDVQVRERTQPYIDRITELQDEVAALRARLD